MSSLDDREFGHFRLPLTLNKGHVDVKVAERLIATTNRYLNRFEESRPEHYANWNLLGVISFRIGQFEEALQYLKKVLSPNEDPDNLNALANRKYVCEKLSILSEARDSEQKMARLLRQGNTVEGETELNKLKARSIAEQAFAFTNEIFEESTTTERYERALDLYQRAIELAGEDVTPSEREDWIIESGMACQQIYKRIKGDESKTNDKKLTYRKAVDNFITIVQHSEDNYRKSVAWRNLGQLFGKGKLRDQEFLLQNYPSTFRVYVRQPDKCFEEALSLSPNDPEVLTKQAQNISHTEPDTALCLIEKALFVIENEHNSEFSPRPYHIRATIYLSKYNKQLKEFKKSRLPHSPDETLLTRAEKDLRFAIQDVSVPWYNESMAEVLYYMATDCYGKLKDEQKPRLHQALIYCAKAEEIADGWKRAEIHKLRGKCLCAIGEHQAALRSYKRALECAIGTLYQRGSAGALVEEYEHILPHDSVKLEENRPLLRDMVYWLEKAARVCLSSDWELWGLENLKKRYNHWRTFVKYCRDNGCERQLKLIRSAERGYRSGFKKYLRPSSHDQDVPTLQEPRQKWNAPSASSVSGKACQKPDTSQGDQYQTQPHAERRLSPPEVPVPVKTRPLLQADVQLTSEPQKEQPTEVQEGRIDLEQSVPALQLDDNAAASDKVQVTYILNTETGTIEDHSVTPLTSSESSGENAPGKFTKPGPKKSFNQKYEYDFFVMYTSSVSEWVERSMLEELEDTGKLKGCVQDRDFDLGKPTLRNYSERIEKSACIIVVVTKDLEKDNIYFNAMLQALHHGKLVIPVLKEERDLPPALIPYTPLEATGAVDWRRLESSIEQQMKPEDT